MSPINNISSNIKIYALGGLDEIGKNMYCIEYLNQIFIVDCGILFPDELMLGVDYIIPNFQYLIDHESQIVGLFITHGHEDHIGGIPFLLRQVKIPVIFASGIAVDLIEKKLSEYKEFDNVRIIEFKSHYKFNFNGIEISFIRLNHSIPDSHAIVFKTELGYIVHTGDFKIDLTPIGPETEWHKILELNASGKVLALLADSTNAIKPGYTDSESKVGKSINALFSHINGRIIIATFASNIYRIEQIVEASIAHNRHIAVIGRSMENAIDVGSQAGYIKAPAGTFVNINEIDNYENNEITIICTGTQGEPMAALSRVAAGQHKSLHLMPNDTVIFSSSPIPGNAEGVNKTINALFKQGVNVITDSPLTDTHASGHAQEGDLKLMLSLIKPKYFLPIHGEYRMQKAHAEIAASVGVAKENIFILENGDVLCINKAKAKVIGKIESGNVYISGYSIGDINKDLIKERKALATDGLFAIIFSIDVNQRRQVAETQVVSRGFLYMKDNEATTSKILRMAYDFVDVRLNQEDSLSTIKKDLIDYMQDVLKKETDRTPIILPIFMEIK